MELEVEEISNVVDPAFLTNLGQDGSASLFPPELLQSESFWSIEAFQPSTEAREFSYSTDDILNTVVSSNISPTEHFGALSPWFNNLPWVTNEGENFVASVGLPIDPQAVQFPSQQACQLPIEPGSGVPPVCEFLIPTQSFAESLGTVLPSSNARMPTYYSLPAQTYEMSERRDDPHKARRKKKW
jgi:hypothetical protein